jgi:hypothetical protein
MDKPTSQWKIGSRFPYQADTGQEFFKVSTIKSDRSQLIGKWYRFENFGEGCSWVLVEPEVEWIYRPGQQPEFVRHEPPTWW